MGTTMLSTLDETSKEYLISELKEFYIPYRDSLELPKIATFGTEIEFSIPGYNNDYIEKLKKQGHNNGAKVFLSALHYPMIWECDKEDFEQIEIISDVLTDNKKTWKTLEYILKFLFNNHAYASEQSGAHIHIGKQLLKNNPEYCCYFLKLWSIFEKEIVRFSNGESYFERRNFSNVADYVSAEIKKIILHLQSGKYDETIGILAYKTNSIYFPPIESKISDLFTLEGDVGSDNKLDTIEIRCPNGTLNKVIWQNNINFFIKMILACASPTVDKELIDYLYQNTILDNKHISGNMELFLADLVFNNDFDKYCFLRQYYKDFEEPKKHDAYAKSKPFWE